MSKSSRARTRDRKRQRTQQRQRNRQMMVIGAVIAVAAVIGALFALANQPSEAPLPEGVLERYQEYEKSFDTDGFPVLGNPDAPVSVVEYSSFSCTHCKEFHEDVFPEVLKRVRQGDIRFTYVLLPNGSVPNPEGANRTALCAGQQDMFWEMHDVLFYWHDRFVNTAFQGNRLTACAEALGINSSQFNSCFDSAAIDAVLTEAMGRDITATPTIQINGTTLDSSELTVEGINAAIDARLPLDAGGGDADVEVEPDTDATEAVDATTSAESGSEDATVEVDTDAGTQSDDSVATEEADGDTGTDSGDVVTTEAASGG